MSFWTGNFRYFHDCKRKSRVKQMSNEKSWLVKVCRGLYYPVMWDYNKPVYRSLLNKQWNGKYSPENEHVPWKSMVRRCIPYWNSPFLGDICCFFSWLKWNLDAPAMFLLEFNDFPVPCSFSPTSTLMAKKSHYPVITWRVPDNMFEQKLLTSVKKGFLLFDFTLECNW